jgi:ArsR family transcriptional regulator, arsenate/arsenite/antimonite-responsive transcriptional repressor
MGSPWKALSDDNRRRILLLLKEKDMITPTAIADHFGFTMPGVSINLRILKEADLVTEKREGKSRMYSLNRNTTSELVRFFDDMYDYNLKSLKEYVENKRRKRQFKSTSFVNF